MRTDIGKFIERPGKSTDMALVFASWLNSERDTWREMRTGDFHALQHQRIERLLSGPARLVVLHPEGAPDVIAAWACLDQGPDIAHYVVVKSEYRGRGFARRLLAGRTIATHMAKGARGFKNKLGLRYMPHLLDGLGE